jgi:hypothetical protein
MPRVKKEEQAQEIAEAVAEADKVEAPKLERITDASEFKKRALERKANRSPLARDFPLPSLGVIVKVAPAGGEDVYNKLLEIQRISANDGDMSSVMDIDSLKLIVKASVIEPELDDETIDLLIGINAEEFQLLASFCISHSMQWTQEQLVQALGVVDTTPLESFLGNTTNTSSI